MKPDHIPPSIFAPETPVDVRRATTILLVLAGLCLVYSSLYGNIHLFRSPQGVGLPYVSAGAETLFVGLRAVALLAAAWAIGLALAATPSVAACLVRLWHRTTRAAGGHAAWGIAAVLAGLYAVARVAFTAECLPATLADLTAGAAQTPFQYRALVPFAVQQAVTHTTALGTSPWLPYGVVEALASFGAYASMRAFLRPYVASVDGRSLAALLVFVLLGLNLATPFRHNPLFFPWDTLSVALFTAGLALMHQRRWLPYYALFVVATFNRETTCFLTIALVLSQWGRMPLLRLTLHGAAQLALWASVKGLLVLAYAANAPLSEVEGATGLFVTPYVMNLGAVSGVPGLLMLCGAMGTLWLVPALLDGRMDHPDLRRLFRFVPVFLVGMFVVGEVLEVRIYSELIPLVAAALVVVLRSVVSQATGRAVGQKADPYGEDRPTTGLFVQEERPSDAAPRPSPALNTRPSQALPVLERAL